MTNDKQIARVARNAVANWILFLFTALVSFFLSPFIVQHLGANRYGVWSLLASLTGYLGLLDFGIRQGVNRYIAHHRAVDASDECATFLSTAVTLFSWFGVIAVLLSGLVAIFAPILFNIPANLIDDARIIIVLGGATVALSLLTGAFGGAITGFERFDISSGLEILVLGTRTIATVIVLSAGYGLVVLACVHLAASIFSCVASWATVRLVFGTGGLRWRGFNSPHARKLLAFGASVSVISLLIRLISYSDSMIIASFLPIEAVTYFAIAGSLCLYAKELVASLAYVMAPRVSALTSVGSDRVGSEIVAVAGIATLMATAIALTFLIRGESFISLWMGPTYGPTSAEVLRVLAVVVWVEAARIVVMNTLVGMGRQRILIPGIAFEATCKLALSFALVGPFGMVGVALGSLIPSVMVNWAFIPRCLTLATKVQAGRYYREAILLPTLACVPFAMASAVLERYFPAASLLTFFSEVILILPLVPLAAWSFCLSGAEKIRIKSWTRKWVER